MRFSEILEATITRLKASVPLGLIVNGRIFNDPPQKLLKAGKFKPFVKVIVDVGDNRDTKGSNGFLGEIEVHFWTAKKGDIEVLDAFEAIYDALHRQPLALVNGLQSVALSFSGQDIVEENDGAHHGIFTFEHFLKG